MRNNRNYNQHFQNKMKQKEKKQITKNKQKYRINNKLKIIRFKKIFTNKINKLNKSTNNYNLIDFIFK